MSTLLIPESKEATPKNAPPLAPRRYGISLSLEPVAGLEALRVWGMELPGMGLEDEEEDSIALLERTLAAEEGERHCLPASLQETDAEPEPDSVDLLLQYMAEHRL
jgi:hypothetical protein